MIDDVYRQYAVAYQLAREAAGFTQEEAAFRLGISKRYLQYIEAGQRIPKISLASDMALLYNCTFMIFFIPGMARKEESEYAAV